MVDGREPYTEGFLAEVMKHFFTNAKIYTEEN
jgi:hypothetical protein